MKITQTQLRQIINEEAERPTAHGLTADKVKETPLGEMPVGIKEGDWVRYQGPDFMYPKYGLEVVEVGPGYFVLQDPSPGTPEYEVPSSKADKFEVFQESVGEKTLVESPGLYSSIVNSVEGVLKMIGLKTMGSTSARDGVVFQFATSDAAGKPGHPPSSEQKTEIIDELEELGYRVKFGRGDWEMFVIA